MDASAILDAACNPAYDNVQPTYGRMQAGKWSVGKWSVTTACSLHTTICSLHTVVCRLHTGCM